MNEAVEKAERQQRVATIYFRIAIIAALVYLIAGLTVGLIHTYGIRADFEKQSMEADKHTEELIKQLKEDNAKAEATTQEYIKCLSTGLDIPVAERLDRCEVKRSTVNNQTIPQSTRNPINNQTIQSKPNNQSKQDEPLQKSCTIDILGIKLLCS